MKKVLLMACMALLGIGSMSAQSDTFKGLQWEANVGMNNSDWGGLGAKIGFHIGAKAEMTLPSIADGVYANAGAFLTLKGCKQDYGDLAEATSNAYYLEIPIHIGYKYIINEKIAVYGDVGPYIAFGLFGKSKATAINDWTDGSTTTEKTNTFGDHAKRFDLGAGLKVGVEFMKKYTFSIGYDWGFIDCYKDMHKDEDVIDLTPSMKHKNLTISLGYRF